MLKPPACTDSVLIVLPWSPELPGGVSVVVRNLLRIWTAEGKLARVIVSDWNAQRPTLDANGDTTFRFAIFGKLSPLSLAKSLISAPRQLWRTWRLLKSHRITAVNFHYPSLDALGIAVLRRLGLFKGQLVLSFHGTDVRSPSTPSEILLWRCVFNMSTAVTTCSKTLAHEVALAYKVTEASISVIYNGVDASLFHPKAASSSAIPQPQAKPYIVSIGSYIPRKGHCLLLDAFAKVLPLHAGLRLVIVGMDGSERATLLIRAEALGLLEDITLRVNLKPDEVAVVVAGATLCVQPSTAEPFGLAVIEAGACGVPVLASAVGGHVELIADHQNGCLFAPGDVTQCAEKILYMLMNGDAADQMAERFRSEIQVKYTWPVCANAYRQRLEAHP